MSDQSNGATERVFSRIEAAAFLSDRGHRITPQRLAARASENRGPPFTKSGRSVVYKESDLVAWAAKPEGRHKRPPKRPPRRSPSAAKVVGDVDVDLRGLLREHIELADQFLEGDAPDMRLAVRFVRSIETLRRLVR